MAFTQSGRVEWNERELAPLCSPYLSGDYKKETISLTGLRRDEGGFVGDYSVAGRAIDAFGTSHLASPIAFIMVAQMAVVCVHIDQGLAEKIGTVYLSEVSFRFLRQVKSSEVSARLEILDRERLERGMYYKMSGSIASGAFLVKGSVMHMHDPAAGG